MARRSSGRPSMAVRLKVQGLGLLALAGLFWLVSGFLRGQSSEPVRVVGLGLRMPLPWLLLAGAAIVPSGTFSAEATVLATDPTCRFTLPKRLA